MLFFMLPLSLGLTALLANLFWHFDHGDIDAADYDDGPALVSVKVIATFLASFGAIGLLATYQGYQVAGASVWGVAGGVIVALVMFGLLHLLYRQQANSHLSVEDLVGATAMVTVEIQKDSFGEIIVSRKGQQQTFLAMFLASYPSASSLKPGSIVVIEGFAGPHAVVRPTQPPAKVNPSPSR